MAEEEKDQVQPEVPTDQPGEEQSEEAEKEPTEIEKLTELTKGLQKGYTVTRQEIAEMRGNLQSIADSINKQSGATTGEDEYLTVGKLREILSQQSAETEQRKSQADTYIANALEQLRANGQIASEADENELLNYALKIKEPDLMKAAEIFQDIKEAKASVKKDIAKTKVKQEEGSKVGTSSKTSREEQKGVDYAKIHLSDWSDL